MIFIFFLLLTLFTPRQIYAIYDPSSVPNNKYGIHIADSNDIEQVAPLINSSGGEWGYVTFVISENDRSVTKWQKIFDQMRRLHLIPIVRLATHVEGSAWSVPKKDSFREWVDFLSKLRWIVKNRYVILFNEPNHANEWGKTIHPEEYADTLVTLGKALKDAFSDFFILPAGLDASASNDGEALDEQRFIERMLAAKPEIATLIDGWTSHSYPNPGFSGSPYAWGRGTLRTFDWEINLLGQLGVTKPLPIFITETGWIHSQGKIVNGGLLPPERVGENLHIAATNVWSDPKIIAVTPFVFNYQDYPFDHFSWKKLGSSEYYPHYFSYQTIAKQKGRPKQLHRFELTSPFLPGKMITGSSYTFSATIINIGESILDPADSFDLVVDDGGRGFSVRADPVPTVEPGETGTMTIHIKTLQTPGKYALSVNLKHFDEIIPIEQKDVTVLPPPAVRISAQLGWRKTSEASNASVLVYQKNTLIHKFTGLTVKNGSLTVSGLTGVVPKEEYRMVMLVPYYLPRQKVVIINEQETDITMKRFVPLDFNNDGTFSIADLPALFSLQPNAVANLFFGP